MLYPTPFPPLASRPSSVASPGREEYRAVFLAAGALVSVPVFLQAPLVRSYPGASAILTVLWVLGGIALWRQPRTRVWGDLLLGFSWSWLAGGIYWGWLRWEPLIHLPVEAIGLPFAIWGASRGIARVGSFFYLGSLLGTAITDLYFYLTGIIPYWRQLMGVEPDPALVAPILHHALEQVQTPRGIALALALVSLLLVLGSYPLRKRVSYWWAFSGAILSTIVVDGLFWVTAFLA